MREVQLIACFFTLLLVVSLTACSQKASEEIPAASDTNVTAKASPSPATFAEILGKWARTDGDYLLEIKSVEADGKMDAAYYNPNPIKVARALGISEGKVSKVFVELRDEGYPGCTYSLTYSPESDQLFGTYFQAALQQTFEVVFSRAK